MELSEEEGASVEAELAPPPPLVQQPQFNLPINFSGSSRARGAVAAAAVPKASRKRKEAVDHEDSTNSKHFAEFFPVNHHTNFRVPQFVGQPGPTYADEIGGTRSYQESLGELKRTKLFFFEKYFDGYMKRRIVKESNAYVQEMKEKPRPPLTSKQSAWPPKWTENFPQWTIPRLM